MTTTQHTEPLIRTEADIVVRQLAGRYYDRHGVDNTGRFDYFAAQLAWQIGGENTRHFREHLLEILAVLGELDADYWAKRADNSNRNYWEGLFNIAVHDALSAANVPGPMIRRYTEPVAA